MPGIMRWDLVENLGSKLCCLGFEHCKLCSERENCCCPLLQGLTALQLAIRSNAVDSFKFLLSQSADPDLSDRSVSKQDHIPASLLYV